MLQFATCNLQVSDRHLGTLRFKIAGRKSNTEVMFWEEEKLQILEIDMRFRSSSRVQCLMQRFSYQCFDIVAKVEYHYRGMIHSLIIIFKSASPTKSRSRVFALTSSFITGENSLIGTESFPNSGFRLPILILFLFATTPTHWTREEVEKTTL